MASNSAASPFWYHGSSQSCELSQLGGATEIQSKENQVVWNPRQKDISGNPMNNNSSGNSRVRVEGMWPPSHMNISSNHFPDLKSNKAVSAQPSSSGYPPVSSRPNDGQVENGKKSESSVACRLFGVNLTNNSSNVAPPEKELGGRTTMIPTSPKESPLATCETERSQNPNCSVSKTEQKQVTSNSSPNERQSKQASLPSTRTRTKVHVQLLRLKTLILHSSVVFV